MDFKKNPSEGDYAINERLSPNAPIQKDESHGGLLSH